MTADDLLRKTSGEKEQPVGFVELFFDLVFVFAVTQVTATLAKDLSALGALKTLILFLATWWSWINTTWVTNWLEVERAPVRLLLFVLMGLGLLQAAILPKAFDDYGMLFALTYVGVQLGRCLFTLTVLILGRSEANQRNYLQLTLWTVAAAPFWLIGGAAETDARLGWWALAVAVEYAAPLFRFHVPFLGRARSHRWDLVGTHISERCALFIIIALGEAIIATGATFAGQAVTLATTAALAVAFFGTAAFWWLYFDVGAKRASKRMEEADSPGWLARTAYTYLHVPIVAGLVVAAVADKKSITDPLVFADAKYTLVAAGGTALFLLGMTMFKKTTAANGRAPRSHLIGLGLCVALVFLSPALSRLGVNLLAVAILVAVVILERVRRDEPTIDPTNPREVMEVDVQG